MLLAILRFQAKYKTDIWPLTNYCDLNALF